MLAPVCAGNFDHDIKLLYKYNGSISILRLVFNINTPKASSNIRSGFKRATLAYFRSS